MTRIAMVPLDERPVSTSLPAAIAAVAGVHVDLPPPACLPQQKAPGDLDALGAWLAERCTNADAAVISLEGLGLGSLLRSRVGHETPLEVMRRWSVLTELDVPVHASVVIPRTPDADDDWEEPEYWSRHGRDLHALSTALHSGVDVERRRDVVPPSVRADWLGRRLRQHVLALSALDMTHRGVLSTLLVGVDDAAPGSLSEIDQRAVEAWRSRLELSGRVLVRPGTDEAGAVLTARAITQLLGVEPRIAVVTAAPGGLDRTAPYETDPVGRTAYGLVEAAGGVAVPIEHVAGGHVDAVLVVHAPDDTGDWATAPPVQTDAVAAARTADLVADVVEESIPVGIADTAQPNGADPGLLTALTSRVRLIDLGAYAAWNTAGNTIGSAVAHLVAYVVGRHADTIDADAHEALLARRTIEDWAYMSVARPRLRHRTGSDPLRHDTVDPTAAAAVETELQTSFVALGEFESWRIVPGSTRFPWQRTFEIDLKVEKHW